MLVEAVTRVVGNNLKYSMFSTRVYIMRWPNKSAFIVFKNDSCRAAAGAKRRTAKEGDDEMEDPTIEGLLDPSEEGVGKEQVTQQFQVS